MTSLQLQKKCDSWPNMARAESCLMLATWLKAGVVPWNGSPGHYSVYQSSRANVLIGYIGAGSATTTHGHFHDLVAVLVSYLGAATETIECKKSGNKRTISISSLAPGQIVTNLLPSPGVPYVHRMEIHEGDATFIAVESPLPSPPLNFRVPSICITGQAMSQLLIKARNFKHFYSSVEIVIPAGEPVDVKADATTSAIAHVCRGNAKGESIHEENVLKQACAHTHVVRLICTVHSGSDQLIIVNRPQGKLKHIDKQFGPIQISAHFVTDFPNQPEALQTRIHNMGAQDWHGVILDVYAGTYSKK